jgi:hypothetical protein
MAVGPHGGATVAAGGTDGDVQLWAGGRDPGGQHPRRRGRRHRRRRRRRPVGSLLPPCLGRRERDRPPVARTEPGRVGLAGALPVCFSGCRSPTRSLVVARPIRHSPSAPHVIRLRAVDPYMTRTATQMRRAPACGECAEGGQGQETGHRSGVWHIFPPFGTCLVIGIQRAGRRRSPTATVSGRGRM